MIFLQKFLKAGFLQKYWGIDFEDFFLKTVTFANVVCECVIIVDCCFVILTQMLFVVLLFRGGLRTHQVANWYRVGIFAR